MTEATAKPRELKGWHVLVITCSAFAIIIGVNLLMAYKAISTFPGLEVQSSYVASQDFDSDRAAQIALGWTLTPGYDLAKQELSLRFTDKAGAPVTVAALEVLLGRTTEAKDDSNPVFQQVAGVYVANVALTKGKWMLHVEAKAPDGTLFQQRIDLYVKG